MYKIIFDSNIYNKLDNRPDIRRKIKSLITNNKLSVVVPTTISRELEKSPFKGVPDWFNTECIGDSAFILDYSRLDVDRLGGGDTYNSHRGNSKKIQDALIADTAETDADIFVSEDNRCRERLKNISNSCKSLTFSDFETWLFNIN